MILPLTNLKRNWNARQISGKFLNNKVSRKCIWSFSSCMSYVYKQRWRIELANACNFSLQTLQKFVIVEKKIKKRNMLFRAKTLVLIISKCNINNNELQRKIIYDSVTFYMCHRLAFICINKLHGSRGMYNNQEHIKVEISHLLLIWWHRKKLFWIKFIMYSPYLM
jgi:hypothetical protein